VISQPALDRASFVGKPALNQHDGIIHGHQRDRTVETAAKCAFNNAHIPPAAGERFEPRPHSGETQLGSSPAENHKTTIFE